MGDGWQSGAVSERAYCLLAPNPGPMTLEGTNTWVLLEPGSTEALVVDRSTWSTGRRCGASWSPEARGWP